MKLFGGIVAMGALVVLGMVLAGCAATEGAAAPDFELESVQSAAIKDSLKAHHGKVVLLDFWATWCGPCRMISPVLDSFYDKYHAQGLDAMGILPDSGDSRTKVQNFLAGHAKRIPQFLDPNQIAAEGYQAHSFPTIVLIARNGKIISIYNGFTEETPKDLEQKIIEALKQPA